MIISYESLRQLCMVNSLEDLAREGLFFLGPAGQAAEMNVTGREPWRVAVDGFIDEDLPDSDDDMPSGHSTSASEGNTAGVDME